MNRRGFLGSLAALAVAPFAPKPPALAFHEGSFVLASPAVAEDRQTGIAIRFIQQFDIEAAKRPTRTDWIYDSMT